MTVRTLRTSDQIRAEIEQTFGFFPPFFAPALSAPQVLENLWQQTLSAYVENPFSALFKEKLNAVLSRFCAAPYCMIVHSAALRPLGMTARQVLALLDVPSQDQETGPPLGEMPAPQPEEAAAPAPDSSLEQTLLYCATAVFLEQADMERCQAEMRRLLGSDLYSHLIAYLAYIKTCHLWIESYPEVSYEADQRAQDHLGALLAEEPALAEFFRTYQARVAGVLRGRVSEAAAAAERARSQEAVRDSEEKLRLLVDGAKDYAMILLNADGQVTSWNTGAERILGWTEEEVLGRPADLIFTPEDRAVGVPAEEIARAATEGKALDLRWHLRKDGSHFFADGIMESLRDEDGTLRGFAKVLRDATEQTERAERERFLADLTRRSQALADPDAVIADAVRSTGEFLGVSRCIFADIDIEADTCTIHASEYRADPSAASIVGVVSIASFGAFVVAEYAARRAVAVDDVRRDSLRAPEGSLAAYEAIGIRAHVTVPVVHFDRVVSCMSVHSAAPRHWKPEEIQLLRAVVERTWLTVEVTRQQQALARESQVLREAHERTARILESTTDAFFALDRGFRFTYINAHAERLLSRTREELLGKNIWDEFPDAVGGTFHRVYTRAMEDGLPVSVEDYYAPLSSWMDVRVFPSPDGLSVFFQNVSERRALEAERERLAERERNISAQLQDALQPAVPENISGLAVASFTRPALQEAQIGGDFSDLFPLGGALYAVVIGDVSGKGLAAAQQLALIRNSLRTTLYLYREAAQAATHLNAILTAHDLLLGFVTAFVGVYDAALGQITYVSCGHEPGLIKRIGGEVEEMQTTGPPLGVDPQADYSAQAVTLSEGDILLLYTDGISEAGISRRELLGTAGLTRIVAALPGICAVQTLAERLVSEVSRYAGGVFRDDVAVLLAQRQPFSTEKPFASED